jgi:hypothetical protein
MPSPLDSSVTPVDPAGSPTGSPADTVAPGGPGAIPTVPTGAVSPVGTSTVPDPAAPTPGDPNVPGPDPIDPVPPSTPIAPGPDATLPVSPDPISPDPVDPTPVDPGPTDPNTPAPSSGNQCEGGALAPGFYVQDGRIYDNHCGEFVMRGVNYPHVWYKDSQSTEQMFQDIAATGANTVRVVLATGGQWTRIGGSEVANIISWAKANKLVAMLEVHDATGYGDMQISYLQTAFVARADTAECLPLAPG